MKTYILEKRERSFDRWELAKLKRQNIDALCCIEGETYPEELYRTSDRDEALAKLAECRNEICGNRWDGLGIVEYVVAEGEIDEDGFFIGDGYWGTDSYKEGWRKYEALHDGNTLNHQRLWYAVQEDEEDDWCTGSLDKDEAVEMAKSRGYKLIAVIKENVEYGEVIDTLCIEELHAGEDF